MVGAGDRQGLEPELDRADFARLTPARAAFGGAFRRIARRRTGSRDASTGIRSRVSLPRRRAFRWDEFFVDHEAAAPIAEHALDDRAHLLPRQAAIAHADPRDGDARNMFGVGQRAHFSED